MAINLLLEARLASLLEEVEVIKGVIVVQTLLELTKEPECPSCGCGVLRPSCLRNLSAVDCPRHEIIRELGGHERLWKIVGRLKDGIHGQK